MNLISNTQMFFWCPSLLSSLLLVVLIKKKSMDRPRQNKITILNKLSLLSGAFFDYNAKIPYKQLIYKAIYLP